MIDNENNLVPVGNRAHEVLTRGTSRQIMALPNIKAYLRKMKTLNEQYYYRFCVNRGINYETLKV